jgi:hypothetical protein
MKYKKMTIGFLNESIHGWSQKKKRRKSFCSFWAKKLCYVARKNGKGGIGVLYK